MNDIYNPNINSINIPIQDMEKIKEEQKAKAIARFRVIGIPSLIYGLICAISLYNAYSGIFSVFAVIATVYYTLHVAKIFNKKVGKFIYFNCIISILLSISTFTTGNKMIIFYNYCGIILLVLVNGLYLFVNFENVSVAEHVKLFTGTVFSLLSHIGQPFSDLISSRSLIKKKDSSKYIYILVGIILAIPTVLITGGLLASADQVFSKSFENLFILLDFDFLYSNLIGLGFIAAITYFASYKFVHYLSSNEFAPHKGKVAKFEPIVAIIVNASISFMYVVFCGMQIYYLFLQAGTLPENYTYARYAREGFFQLLCVCIFNIIIVLICCEFFRDNKVLSYLNIAISICTFIMIASSAYRMIMYIAEYGLTTTRVLVLWFLILVTFIMIGLLFYIAIKKFNLFKYTVILTSVCYLLLSFGHIDYFIAYYNINMYSNEKLNNHIGLRYNEYVDYIYINKLSSDAAPVIYDNYDVLSEELDYDEKVSEYKNKNIRNFNVSNYIAEKLYEEKVEK